MFPIFLFAKRCWSIHSTVVRLGKNAHSKQRKASPKLTAVSRQVYVHGLLVEHYTVCFFNIWFGVVQHQKQLRYRESRQIDWNISIYTKLKKITSKIYSNFPNYYSLFFKSLKFRCCSFYLKKQFTVDCPSVLLILFSTSYYIFQRKSKEWESGTFFRFYCVFFMWAFKNNGLFVLVQSNYFNTEDNYERLIDFLTVLNYGSKP